MSRIIVLRWEKDQPGCPHELLGALEYLPTPERYAVSDYVNIDGKTVVVRTLTGGCGSWTTTEELLIKGGLFLHRPIASVVIEFNADAFASAPS